MMVKFGLIKKEEKLFDRASSLMMKASDLQCQFYNSIEERFDKAGYDGDFVQDTLIASDAYVFSESGCSGEYSYGQYEDVWEYIRHKCPRYKKEQD